MIQGDELWFEMRRTALTASKFAEAIGTPAKRKAYALRKLAELDGVIIEDYRSPAMEWGIEQQGPATMHYWAETGLEVAMHPGQLHPDHSYIWGSPDGLVGDDGILEIKCPNSTTHIEYCITKKVPQCYVPQIQGLMWIFDRQWADFVSFDPRNPTRPMSIVRVARDQDFIDSMAVALKDFWEAIREGRLPDNGGKK